MTGTVGDAFALATIAHQGQQYGDRPYMTHVIGVAKLYLAAYGAHEHMLIAALLHDVVEDTAVTLYEVEQQFGQRVASIVDAVTQRESDETYMDFVRRSADHPDGVVIKLADNTFNLRACEATGDPRRRRYLRARPILVEALGGDDPWENIVPGWRDAL